MYTNQQHSKVLQQQHHLNPLNYQQQHQQPLYHHHPQHSVLHLQHRNPFPSQHYIQQPTRSSQPLPPQQQHPFSHAPQQQHPFHQQQPPPKLQYFNQAPKLPFNQPPLFFNQFHPPPTTRHFHHPSIIPSPTTPSPLPAHYKLPTPIGHQLKLSIPPQHIQSPTHITQRQSNIIQQQQQQQQQQPPSTPTLINTPRRKFKLRLPLEHTPNEQLSQDESRIRSRWIRTPLKLSPLQIYHSPELVSSEEQQLESYISRKEYSDEPPTGQRPTSIDVYLPGRELWDECRIEILSNKLTELGYPTKIVKPSNPLLNFNLTDEEEEERDLRTRLDLREPSASAPPSAQPTSPIEIPKDSLSLPISALTSHSEFPLSSTSSSSSPSSVPSPLVFPSLKPTAAEFKPNNTSLLQSSHPTNPFSSIWGPPLPASQVPPTPLLLQPPSSSAHSHPMSSSTPTLNMVGEEDEEDVVTDSDPDQQEDESNPDSDPSSNAPSRLGNQQLNEAQDEDDDIPLARLQHSLQQNHLADASAQPLSARFLSAHNNHANHGESAYDADSDRQSDCTNPSDEEEAHDMMAIAGTPQQERISNGSLSTPNTRLGRSHTFGFSRLSNTRKSMSAGEGHPHNWINGFEDEEEDIVSNPSDEEEAELHHLQRTVIKSSLPEITSPRHQPAVGSTFKNSTPTSRFLLDPRVSPDPATNLAITVGRATGNVMAATGSVMSIGLVDSSSSSSPHHTHPHQPSVPKLGSASGLNAFAAEFKPSFSVSPPPIRNPSITFSDNRKASGSSQLQLNDETGIPSGSPQMKTQVMKTQGNSPLNNEAKHVDNAVVIANSAPNGTTPSIILFEHPVSSAPFQASNSLSSIPAPKELDPVSTTPDSCKKIIDPPSEQPGKDNMRSFKFPTSPTSRMVLYQSQMSHSGLSSSAVSSTVMSPLQAADKLKQTVNPLVLGASNGADPKGYPNLVIQLPASSASSRAGSADHSILLRQRSSFEDDDSGSELSPSAARTVVDQNDRGSLGYYELIPTQPRSRHPRPNEEEEQEVQLEEEEEGDEALEHRSHNSLVSLRQLQEQKRQWGQLSSTGLGQSGGSNHSDCDNDHDDGQSDVDHPSNESIQVILDSTSPRKRESKPPQVNVPPGSPFSPFDERSLQGDPPTLRLPPPAPHVILPPTIPRLLAYKPSKNNLAQSFKTNASTSPPHVTSRDQHDEEFEGVAGIPIRNRNIAPSAASPRSPATRWFASLEDGEDLSKSKPEISTAEDETLCSSKKLDEENDDERDASTGDSSSGSSFNDVTDPKRHSSGKSHEMKSSHATNPHRQLFMSDLERLLTKKLKGLRQDLGELHSLKVDWDSLKRDAILDEINVRMGSILNNWLGGSHKEKGEGDITSSQSDDLMAAAINQWGSKTEEKLLSAIESIASSSTALGINNTQSNSEVTQKIESVLELLKSQSAATHSLNLDLDEITGRLAEAVKPQIGQLIDLTSDKSETADLILKQLKPCFAQLNNELTMMIKSLSAENAADNQHNQQPSMIGDGAGFWKDLEERLISAQIDKEQRLLEEIEKRFPKAGFEALKKSSDATLDTVHQLEAQNSTFYRDLSGQIDRVGHELGEDLKAEVEKIVGRRKEAEELIERLRAKNVELEASVIKARGEYGKIRSERAVERERQQEDQSQLSHERDALKVAGDSLREQLEVLQRDKTAAETEKNSLARQVDELKPLVDELKTHLGDSKARELRWESEKSEQKQNLESLQMTHRLHESEISTMKKEIEMKEKFYESRSTSNEREIQSLKEREMEQAAQIKSLIEDKIPLIKNFDQEIRDLIKLKSEADGEIRSLKKRITDQDEQIGNLHQSSASKQQALAMANQKLSELERRGKQESEGLKGEVEKLKAELSRVTQESEAQSQTQAQEKAGLEREMERMRVEAGQIKEEVEAVYQSIAGELKESHTRRTELEAELGSSKDVNQLLKNQLADLRAYHEKQQERITARPKSGPQQGPGLMVMDGSCRESLEWKSHHSSPARDPRYRPPSEAAADDSSSAMADFVTSTIPLNHSIHAPQPTATMARHSSSAFLQQPQTSGRSRSSSRLSTGTVTHLAIPHHHSNPADLPSPAQFAHAHRLPRSVSPTPSRASVVSRLTLDQDGWWSSQDY
ncbi:hypothetical protein PCANC_05802 [Puccinia coronata f. sp. avenae]|uniref:Uncharacterized protein n=1 Tax=Puccinia coronata f. sp. avenae TaxID=200324 RepID=A0A2N5VSW1_9BASI|nr:hypothetical protein PCANC_05802 [Puccinia coronata f. sp. avenae]